MYALQESDYGKLFPYMTPRQIKEKFGDMAMSERWISQYNLKNFKKSARTARCEIIKNSYTVVDLESNTKEWNVYLAETIDKIAMKKKKEIWERIDFWEKHKLSIC